MWICELRGWAIFTSMGLLEGMFWLTWRKLSLALFIVTYTHTVIPDIRSPVFPTKKLLLAPKDRSIKVFYFFFSNVCGAILYLL
jgi:hypothetical protein